MAKCIYKFGIPVDDQDHQHNLPIGSRVVDVASTDAADVVWLWAEFHHPPGEDTEARQFRVFGTGHVVPEQYEYVGTCQARYGLVWHLYERKVA